VKFSPPPWKSVWPVKPFSPKPFAIFRGASFSTWKRIGTAALLAERVERMERRVRDRVGRRRDRRERDALHAGVEREARLRDRTLGHGHRDVRHGQQARIARAELEHAAREGARRGVRHVDVLRAVGLARRERREHELRVEPERVERAVTVLGVERAVRVPALPRHQLGLVRGALRRDAGARAAARDHLLDEVGGAGAAE
jgi:hypothetical protein